MNIRNNLVTTRAHGDLIVLIYVFLSVDELTPPDGVLALYLTKKTQTEYCSELNSKQPHLFLPTERLLDDIKVKGADSDFHQLRNYLKVSFPSHHIRYQVKQKKATFVRLFRRYKL